MNEFWGFIFQFWEVMKNVQQLKQKWGGNNFKAEM